MAQEASWNALEQNPKAWVSGRSLAGIAVSNPAEGMDVFLL
jgi:hypothetical protein